ncbi:hypothetical protein B0H14DRAFT_2572417 [Mycena olivaceomarginata]|nr:hypothetical protein B0H14DRAFT_2572417 [Mycena olivaceomarginata]
MGASVCFSFVVSNSGRLHFSACQTGLRPRQRVRIPQSSVATWIFGEHPTILPGHNALVRTGTCSGYTTGATRMPGENQSLRYLEGSMVGGTEIGWFRLPSLPLPKFHIWSGDSGNQTFRTSQNRRYPRPRFPSVGRMELSRLSQTHVHRSSSEWVLEKCSFRIQRDRFTLALGNENRKSFLIVGDNAGSAVQVNGQWSPWIKLVPSARYWTIHLKSLTIGEETHNIDRDVILDSGTTYSFFPTDACESLDIALGGRALLERPSLCTPASSLWIEPSRFDLTEYAFPAALPICWIPDQTPWLRTRCQDKLVPMRHSCPWGTERSMGMFRRGLENVSWGMFCSDVNPIQFFFLGLVVEFERTDYAPGGRVRFASRGNDI